jgi:type VI secretion system protein ImpE
MDTKELIRAGRLQEARIRITEEVKASPSDAAKRTLLFQVLVFCGEWDKAERHLEILAERNLQAETGVQVYRNLISAEKKRAEVFQGNGRPSWLTKMPDWLENLFLAREKLSAGSPDEASAILRKIAGQTPAVSGFVDGMAFRKFRDTDDVLAHFLEVFIHDSYLWFPFSSLREISISEPKSQLDLLWVPARIAVKEGLAVGCYLPVLYPDSCRSDDDRVRLGRITDWRELGSGLCQGIGQHVFLAGNEEKPLLEIREILFHEKKKGDS